MNCNPKKILISGTSSGLGKFILKKLKGEKYNRNKNISFYKKKKWDIIIHSAFYNGSDIKKYSESIKQTFLLSKLNSKKMIFISSAAVYEGIPGKRDEKSKIIVNKKHSTYAMSKIICEEILPKNSIIIRLGTIVGKEMRKNNIYKIIKLSRPKVSISKKSIYSFVSYSEILEFIKVTFNKKLSGIFNFLRTDYIYVYQICNKLNKKVKYGKFVFKCTKASNKKVQKLINLDNKSSIDVIKEELA